MNLLAIDTTSAPLSLALQAGDKIFSFHKELARPHDETLMPQALRLLARAGLRWTDLDGLAAACGPGRFTGIRIGMALAAVLAGRLRIPALPVSRLEAQASKSGGRLVCGVLPGHRDEIFYQVFSRASSGRLVQDGEPSWAAAGDWRQARRRLADRNVVFSEGEVRAQDLLPCAARLFRGRRRPRFEPLYLKPASYERKAGSPR